MGFRETVRTGLRERIGLGDAVGAATIILGIW